MASDQGLNNFYLSLAKINFILFPKHLNKLMHKILFIVQRESGLHMRIHIAGVVGYLKGFEVLAEPVLEREPSMYLWEVNPGSGEFDRVEKHIKSQLNQAMTKRMPDGSMRVYWKNRN